jgi:hypothetical protein
MKTASVIGGVCIVILASEAFSETIVPRFVEGNTARTDEQSL